MRSKILTSLFILTFSNVSFAYLFCTSTMVGGARLEGGGFWQSNVMFSSRQSCEHAVRNSGNGLICLNHQDFFYSLYNIQWGEKLDSQYMGFKECQEALKKARKGLVCATAIRRGTFKLINISTHNYKSFSSNKECQEFLDSL